MRETMITKDMLIADIVEQHPELGEVFMEEYGLHCFGCGAGMFETLEQGMMVHGMNEEMINKVITEINAQLETAPKTITPNPHPLLDKEEHRE